ncbi:MAG: DNA-directed RNA polymerase subunit K [Candidatus Bathyarchaeia archaeon]
MSVQEKIFVGPPKITRFEKARIVGARSLQISMGAPILLPLDESLSAGGTGLNSPIEIALKELEIGILPMTIRRTLPDGTYQDIPLKWLIVS